METVRQGMSGMSGMAGTAAVAALLITSGCGGSSVQPTTKAQAEAETQTSSTPVAGRAPATASTRRVTPAPSGRIVFRRFSDGTGKVGSLFLTAPDGSGGQPLTHPPEGALDAGPDWSPDGSHVLFSRILDSESDKEVHQLMQVAADGTGLESVNKPCPPGDLVCGFDGGGGYSPDGHRIAYAHASNSGAVQNDQLEHFDIYIKDLAGGAPRRITHMKPYAGDISDVRWSPNGKQLLFALSGGPGAQPPGGRALFIVDIDGTGMHRITPWALGAGGTPDWTAHRNLIVFRAVVDDESGEGNFFTVHPDGSGLAQVTHFDATTISHQVGFSPDGRWITFGSIGTGGESDVFLCRVDGTDLRQVTKTRLADSSPDWAAGR